MDKKYFESVMSQTILTREEEYALISRFKGDDVRDGLRARDELVNRFMKMIVSRARHCGKKLKRGTYESDFEEMINDGVLGLMVALDKFDPNNVSPKTNERIRLSTYAIWWIDVFIVASSRDRKSLVYNLQSGKLKSIFSKTPRLIKKHGWESPINYAQAVVIAAEIGRSVKPDEVLAMDRLRRVGEYELDAPIKNDEGGDSRIDKVVGQYATEEEIQVGIDGSKVKELLREVAEELSEREREVILRHTYADDPVPISEIAKKYGITKVAMGKIESDAAKYVVDKMRQRMGVQRALKI